VVGVGLGDAVGRFACCGGPVLPLTEGVADGVGLAVGVAVGVVEGVGVGVGSGVGVTVGAGVGGIVGMNGISGGASVVAICGTAR
jgi:hypothetical protein